MNIIRTLVWVAITALLVAFVAMNWDKAPVNFWPIDNGYLHFDWPVGFIALVFFGLGLLPMWLLHRALRWRLARKINTLESSIAQSVGVPAQPSSTLVTPEVK
jgi:uncharacterized integral membrane protein